MIQVPGLRAQAVDASGRLRVGALQTRLELFEVGVERLSTSCECRRRDGDGVYPEDVVDEVVRLVDDHDVAGKRLSNSFRPLRCAQTSTYPFREILRASRADFCMS